MGRAQILQFTSHSAPAPGVGEVLLAQRGCNLQVEVGTASAFVASPEERRSLVVWAHLDTGASQTTISLRLAAQLGLTQIGVVSSHTAGGRVTNPTYAIDLAFVGATLAPRIDLHVGSCVLPFDPARHVAAPNDATNFGVLLGRDVMSTWHIAWDGPSSMVFITE
jgi:hypothetical protein